MQNARVYTHGWRHHCRHPVLGYNKWWEPHPCRIRAGSVGKRGYCGLIPDIDHPNSKISHRMKAASKLVCFLFSHRGFFHTPFLYISLLLLWMWKCPNHNILQIGVFLLIGAFSHLVLDFLNPCGISVFFPFDTAKRRIPIIRTGSGKEKILCICLSGLCLYQSFQILSGHWRSLALDLQPAKCYPQIHGTSSTSLLETEMLIFLWLFAYKAITTC